MAKPIYNEYSLCKHGSLDPHTTKASYEVWRETVFPDDRAAVEALVHDAETQGIEFNIIWRVNGLPTGSERRLMTKGIPVRDADGKAVRYMGIVLDVTSQIRSEHMATAKEIYEAIPGTFSIMDAAGHFIAWNSTMRDNIVGKSDEDLLGLDGFALVHPDDRAFAQQQAVTIMEHGIETSGEVRILTLGGPDYTWRRISGRKIFIDGQPCIMAIGVDITERKRHESLMDFRLRLSRMSEDATKEALLQATIDEAERLTDSTIGFFHVLPDLFSKNPMQVWSTNTIQNECKMDDLQSHMLLERAKIWKEAGNERKTIIHNDFASQLNKQDLPDGHCRLQRELVVPHMNGEMLTAIFGIGNKPSDYTENDADLVESLADLAWDIIARKDAQEAERAIQQQFLQAQKMEVIGQLAGGIAHDYNNMLAVTLGRVEMLLDEMDDKHPFFESLQAILGSTKRSAAITNQMLAFARKQTILPELLDLNEVVDEFLPLLQSCTGESITCICKPGPDNMLIMIDPGQMQQILLNLCLNARDAITGDGTITIETHLVQNIRNPSKSNADELQLGKFAVLTFTDTGGGIAKKNLPHIFEPFFTTKEVGKGTGLGLSSIFGIVNQHRGQIHCTSEQGKGTTFTLFFPLRHHSSGTTAPNTLNAEPDHDKQVILVVEDEPELLSLIKTILENKGYLVHTAMDGETALAIQSSSIDLLLTDVVLPGMNGVELYERMQSTKSGLKCLYMSGHAPASLEGTEALLDGVNFIKKPFSLKDLAGMVSRIINPRQKATNK